MSSARAPGAVKARDCLLSSRSHAPGPGESVRRRITQRGRGLATKRASPKRGGWGVCWGRVLKKRSAAKVWVRSARGVSSQERLGLELATRSPTRRTRELCTAKPFPLLILFLHPSLRTNCQRDGNDDHHHHADRIHLWTY